MGRCTGCHAFFWGDPRYCPGCKRDIWYERYHEDDWDFRRLQQKGGELLEKKRYEEAGVALSAALDRAMYDKEEHSAHRLREAVTDFVNAYCSRKTDITDDRVMDALDYYESEIYGRDEKYRDSLYQLRSAVTRVLPKGTVAAAKPIDYPYMRGYWELSRPQELTEEGKFEPELMSVRHLTLTECFLCLFNSAVRVLSFLQGQSAITTEMVYEEILPIIHPDLDMTEHGENDAANRFGVTLCFLLDDGFEQLLSLYLHGYDHDKAMYLKSRCESIACEQDISPSGLVFAAAMAPVLAQDDAQPAYEMAQPEISEIISAIESGKKALASAVGSSEQAELLRTANMLYAEYSCIYGVCEYLTAQRLKESAESFMDAMSLSAGSGISIAAEELIRCYFYGKYGCEVRPGYAKFYASFISLRKIYSSLCEAAESQTDVAMQIPE